MGNLENRESLKRGIPKTKDSRSCPFETQLRGVKRSIYKKEKMTVEISKLTSHCLILPPWDSYAFQREAENHWGVVWSFLLTHKTAETVEPFVLEWNDA